MKFEASLQIVLLIFLFSLGDSEQSSFEDERCVCTCPRSLCPNGTGPIFIKMIPPNECLCEHVVPPVESKTQHLDICHFCKCQHETRNTTTIKVVVIFIICVVVLLFIYMLFLMCLDPLIQGRQPTYMQQIDDDVNMDNMASLQSRDAAAAAAGGEASGFSSSGGGRTFQRQSSLINRVTNEQQKWKGTVEEQRRNIYDTHSMLN